MLFRSVGVGHLTTAEADADFDPVAVHQELLCGLDLGVQVVGVDAGRHADLLDLHDLLILLCILFPLLLIVAELGIVNDLADRWGGIGRDLHQVHAPLFGELVGLCSGHDAQLSAVGTDDTQFLVTNLFVELMV